MTTRVALLVVVLLAGIAVALLADPQIIDRFRAQPFTAVRVSALSFHPTMRYRSCTPLAHRQLSFSATQPRVYDLITFSRWHGRHTATITYIAPSGTTYTASAFSARDLTSACGFVAIYGQDAAAMPGRWRVQVSVANHVLTSSAFTIRRVSSDAGRLVPSWLCAHQCTIVLQNPDRTTVRRSFSTYALAAAFLTRHPGAVLTRVVGRLSSHTS